MAKARDFYNRGNRFLRRARRLYVAICLRDLELYGNPVIDVMVRRAQEAGLYSNKTDHRSIRHSINGHHYQLTKKREACNGTFGWHNWCRKMDISPWKGYYNHKKKVKCLVANQ